MPQVADKQLRLTSSFSGILTGVSEGKTAFSTIDTHTHSHTTLTSVGTDDHHTEDHVSRHYYGATDEILVENLGTAETNTSYVLKPDGAGGLTFGTGGGGSLWTQNGSDIYYSGGDVGVGISTPSSRLDVQESTDSDREMGRFYNTSTGSSAGSYVTIDTDGSGDSYLKLQIPGVTYLMGIDNSDSDLFKIQLSSVFNTQPDLSMSASNGTLIKQKLTVGLVSTNNGELWIQGTTQSLINFRNSVFAMGYLSTAGFRISQGGSLSANPKITIPTGTPALVNMGEDDTTEGHLVLYGNSTTTGGKLSLYNGDSYDADIEYWSVKAGHATTQTHQDAMVIAPADSTSIFTEVTDLGNIGTTGYHTKHGSRLYWKSGWDSPRRVNPNFLRNSYWYTPVNWTSGSDENYLYDYQFRGFNDGDWGGMFSGWQCAAVGLDAYCRPNYFASDGSVRRDVGDGYLVQGRLWSSQENYSVSGSQGVQLRIWDMGAPDFNSGWLSISTASPSRSFNHGLSTGIYTSIVFVEFCENATGLGYRTPMLGTSLYYTSYDNGMLPVAMNSATVTVRAGTTRVFYSYDTAGATVTRTSGYVRLRAWNIPADWDYGSWRTMSLSTNYQWAHNLGTMDYYLQPMLCDNTLGPGSSSWTLIGTSRDTWYGYQTTQCSETMIATLGITNWAYFKNSSGTNTAPTGTAYGRVLLWK